MTRTTIVGLTLIALGLPACQAEDEPRPRIAGEPRQPYRAAEPGEPGGPIVGDHTEGVARQHERDAQFPGDRYPDAGALREERLPAAPTEAPPIGGAPDRRVGAYQEPSGAVEPGTAAQPGVTPTAQPGAYEQPAPPTTAQPGVTPTAQPGTYEQPAPPTTAQPAPTGAQPAPTTAQPEPTGAQPAPTTAQPGVTPTAEPGAYEQPAPTTTAQPAPPTTAQPGVTPTAAPGAHEQPAPPTTAQPAPTTAQPGVTPTAEPGAYEQPAPTTTAQPAPPTTAQPAPPATAQPGVAAALPQPAAPERANAVLYGPPVDLGGQAARPEIGAVAFERVGQEIVLTGTLSGLSPGVHGFHVHELGDCTGADMESAGGHFDPFDVRHAGPDDPQRHVGDLGNLVVGEDGVARVQVRDELMSFEGPASIIGRAVVVHLNPDDLQTQPSGDSGPRIACGVVGAVSETEAVTRR